MIFNEKRIWLERHGVLSLWKVPNGFRGTWRPDRGKPITSHAGMLQTDVIEYLYNDIKKTLFVECQPLVIKQIDL